MWHASVALVDSKSRTIVPTVQYWSVPTFDLMRETAKGLLAGVGSLPSLLEHGKAVLHYRRSITRKELARLSPVWLAIPADSMAGHGVVLERDT